MRYGVAPLRIPPVLGVELDLVVQRIPVVRHPRIVLYGALLTNIGARRKKEA
jgi:hypothetical protein